MPLALADDVLAKGVLLFLVRFLQLFDRFSNLSQFLGHDASEVFDVGIDQFCVFAGFRFRVRQVITKWRELRQFNDFFTLFDTLADHLALYPFR